MSNGPAGAFGVPLDPGRQTAIASFSLPYCLYLADGVYSMQLDGGLAVELQLMKEWREREETFENVELQNDPDGQYRFATIRAAFTLAPEDDSQRIVLAAANRLVDVYRFATGRAYLRPLKLHDLANLQVERPASKEGEITFAFGAGGLAAAYRDDTEDVHRVVAGMLHSGEPVPLHDELLLTAERLAVDDYTRQAVIDSVAALEVYVEELLRDRLIAAGRDATQIDELLDRERLGDLMKAPMTDAIGWRPTEDAVLWADWLEVNGVRRRATHRGARVTRDEADNAIGVVRRLVQALAAHA